MGKSALESYFSDPNMEIVIASGVRYCLARSSYAPGCCRDYLKTYWKFMSPSLRKIVITEIGKHTYRDGVEKEWMEFLRWAEKGR